VTITIDKHELMVDLALLPGLVFVLIGLGTGEKYAE
jgi:hypothetical protein